MIDSGSAGHRRIGYQLDVGLSRTGYRENGRRTPALWVDGVRLVRRRKLCVELAGGKGGTKKWGGKT